MSEEMQTYLAQISLIIDFHRSSHMKKFIVDTNFNVAVERGITYKRYFNLLLLLSVLNLTFQYWKLNEINIFLYHIYILV